MKKILIAAVIALAAVSLRADADGYVMLSGITPGQLPAPSSAIHGGRLSLIYGECRELYGLDIGVSGYVRERMYGAQFGVVLNYVDIAMGFQSCFANYVEHDFYGFQVGAGYKVNDNLAVFAGLRTMIGSAKYTGYVKNIKYTSVDQSAAAPYTAAVLEGINAKAADMEMTTTQSCVGFTPVIGVDYRLNDQWNFAAKYEFRTKMNLENSSDMNEAARSQAALDKFNDKVNKYVRDDIPGTFTLGVQYSPIENVRLNAGYHFYDDCNSIKYNDEQKLIDGGTQEILFGAEWDATKLLTVSAGWQNTHYDLSDAYMSDLVHNLSSNMIVCGVRFHVTEKISVDLGYMHNFYEERTVETPVSATVTKKDVYERRNDAFAVGVNFDF